MTQMWLLLSLIALKHTQVTTLNTHNSLRSITAAPNACANIMVDASQSLQHGEMGRAMFSAGGRTREAWWQSRWQRQWDEGQQGRQLNPPKCTGRGRAHPRPGACRCPSPTTRADLGFCRTKKKDKKKLVSQQQSNYHVCRWQPGVPSPVAPARFLCQQRPARGCCCCCLGGLGSK